MNEFLTSAAGGALGAAIGAFFIQEGLRKWRAPRLSIEYGQSNGFLTKTPLKRQNLDTGDIERSEACYVRVKVKNRGQNIARRCRAYMTEITRESDGATSIIEDQDSISLAWSHSYKNSQEIDLPRGVNQFVDVCFFEKGSEGLMPAPGIGYPLRFIDEWRKQGVFRLKIVVVADGIDPVERFIKFRWKGNWDSLSLII